MEGTFPVTVKPDTPRLNKQELNFDIKAATLMGLCSDGEVQWFSTGLYAPPGETIKAIVSPPITAYGLSLQIGCHTDDISKESDLKRNPVIVFTQAISAEAEFTQLLNPYGGLIYINATDLSEDIGPVKVTISGGVAAPYFKLHETSLDEWKKTIRYFEAPWAELANSKVTLTVPSDRIRKLEDPTTLMLAWESVLDAEADLAVIPRERSRPERYVSDVQITVGLMHNGYPIMFSITPNDQDDPTRGDSVDIALSTKRLMSQEGWGFFHELGHNHQQDAWTFEGDDEVTNNIFTLYVLNDLIGLPFPECRDVLEPEKINEAVQKYVYGGTNFEQDWVKDDDNGPWLALLFYYQLQQSFGWNAYKKVFKAYQELGANKNPVSNQEKMDLWLTMFSKTVGQNLSPLFVSWGIPVTEGAIASLSDLAKVDLTIQSLVKP